MFLSFFVHTVLKKKAQPELYLVFWVLYNLVLVACAFNTFLDIQKA